MWLKQVCWQTAFVLVFCGVLYLSLRPSLVNKLDQLLPSWLYHWSGVHVFLQTFLAFGVLAFTALMGIIPFLRREEETRGYMLGGVVGTVMFAIGIELVQLRRLPSRSCSWRNLAAAGVGAGLAALLCR